MVEFGQFRLDLDSGELHRGGARIVLQQKVFRALALLIQRSPSVVSREELCWALWPDGESVDFEHGLNTAIRRLRTALEDSSVSPALIETLPRRGYRFIGALMPHGSGASSPGHHVFVGRHRELDVLRDTFARAADGYPQCLLVVGEPGIGKTALIHRFLQESSAVFVAEGQAMGAHVADDPFGPMLEAIRRLGVAHAGVVGLLARHAPSWLPHLPSLVRRADAGALATTSPSRPRMRREFLAFIEAAAAERPILLLLEDVHWADESTLELVQAVASSNMRARVLVICTYRPLACRSGAWISDILRELKSRGRAIALDLQGLTMEETRAYVEVRLPRLQRPAALGAALHERTDGNPLFLGACVEALRNDGQVAENDASTELRCSLDHVRSMLPPSLVDLVRLQVDRLPDMQQRLLRSASVIGVRFTAVLLAQVTGTESGTIEDALDPLARRQAFIRQATYTRALAIDARPLEYSFTHAMYAHTLEQSLAPDHAADLHRRVAEVLEATQNAEQSKELSSELAMHFDRGGMAVRAVPLYMRAADVALNRTACTEAMRHLRRGLQLLEALPEDQRAEAETALQVRLGVALSWTRGFSDPEAAHAFARALELCGRIRHSAQTVPALLGLCRFYGSVGPIGTATDTAHLALEQCRRGGEPALAEAIHHCAIADFLAGRFATAERNSAEVNALIDARERDGAKVAMFLLGVGGRTACLVVRAYILWFLGRFVEAEAVADVLRSSINHSEHVETRGVALAWLAVRESMSGDSRRALAHAEQAMSLAQETDDAITYGPFARLALGREYARRGDLQAGVALIQRGIDQVPPNLYPIGYAFLADAFACSGEWERTLAITQCGLSDSARTGICYMDAELLRLRGLAMNRATGTSDDGAGRESLSRALAIARAQGSRWLELRVAIAMCRAGGLRARAGVNELQRVLGALAQEDCLDLHEARTLSPPA